MEILQDKSISLQELLVLIKRNILLILVSGLIGGFLTFFVCKVIVDPVYEASAKMIVNSRQEQTGSLTNDQITSSQKLVDTYAIIICGQRVLEPVVQKLQLSMDFEQLAKKVDVTSVNQTQVMQIAVQSKDPQEAFKIVEEIVRTCPDIIIEAVEAGSVKTIEPAHLKRDPVSPKTTLFVLLAAFLCMFAVTAFVVVRFLMDNTYHSETDLRIDLGLPILGVIPDYESCLKNTSGKERNGYGKV